MGFLARQSRNRIFHAACDGWAEEDLRTLATVVDRVAHPDSGARYVLLDPGRFAAPDALMYQRSATGKEIDFVGPALDSRIPVECKYSDGPWLRASQTARSAYSGRAILATRGTIDRRDEARAVPTPVLAYLLDSRLTVSPR